MPHSNETQSNAADPAPLQDKTIADFGDQWTWFQANEGYYASSELLIEKFNPIFDVTQIRGHRVAEIGSGTGRIVNMLLDCGADHVVAVEPSDSFEVLKKNVQQRAARVTCLRVTGEKIPPSPPMDYIFSIGVLHHIPDPVPVVNAAYRALRPGGRFCIWLYAHEGNELYLFLVRPVRYLSSRLPHSVLRTLVCTLYPATLLYMALCRYLPLPVRGYVNESYRKFRPDVRRLVIYDQLNPAYAKYYRKEEAIRLLTQAGFNDVQLHHKDGYSWTAVGTK